MFRIRTSVKPVQNGFDRALQALPEAHRQAAAVATLQLHQAATEAAVDVGIDPAVLQVSQGSSAPYVGLTHTPEGDRAADIEYGTPSEAPNAALRSAIRKAMPAAKATYSTSLRRGMGL